MAALPLPQRMPRALSPAGGCCPVTRSPRGHRQGLDKPGRSQGWRKASRPPAWTWMGRPDLSRPGCGPASIACSPCPFTTPGQPNLPENLAQPQPITRKAHGHCHPRGTRTHNAYSLYICVGVAIWENIRVLLPEDMAHSAAGDNLQAAPTHPYPEGDFCKTATPPSLLCLLD